MSDAIVSRLKEERQFSPAAEFSARARVKSKDEYLALYKQSLEQPEAFWREQTKELVWRKGWDRFSQWDLPRAKFFVGAKLNVSESCLDRHLGSETRTQARRSFGRGSPATFARSRTSSFIERSCGFRRRSRTSGSSRVTASPSTWAWCRRPPSRCSPARGSERAHSVVFGGFSSDALRDRINDCEAKVLITQDGAWRRGSVVPLKQMADKALEQTPTHREGRRACANRRRARARVR